MTATVEPPQVGPPQLEPPKEAVEHARRVAKKDRRRQSRNGHGLLAPMTIWLVVFLVLPLVLIVVYTVAGKRDFLLGDTTIGSPTTDNLKTALSGDYLAAFLRAVWFSLVTAFAALLIGYPLAYFIARHGGRHKPLYLILVMIPFWTSYLARMFAWRSLFSQEGAINTVLGWVGLGGVQWLGTPLAVIIVLVYAFLPFMILPLFISIDRLDYRLVEASYDLGANRVSTFFRVTLKQTLAGVLGGSLLVFIPCVGDFATAQIIGGNSSSTRMVGQQIQSLFGRQSNFPLGSALSLLLMVFIIVAMLLYVRSVGGEEGGF